MDEVGLEARASDFVRANKLLVGFGAAGIGLLLIGGITLFRDQSGHQETVEVISTDEQGTVAETKIVVDVAGAVTNPGVYELSSGARVNDALTAAGGMAQEADRIWVHRFINLAQTIPDGAKIYIPTAGEADSNAIQSSNFKVQNDQGAVAGATIGLGSEQPSGLVNINTASKSELDTLWGIGEKRAEAIMTNRPYSAIEELTGKAGIPQNVFDRIKGQVAVQ